MTESVRINTMKPWNQSPLDDGDAKKASLKYIDVLASHQSMLKPMHRRDVVGAASRGPIYIYTHTYIYLYVFMYIHVYS